MRLRTLAESMRVHRTGVGIFLRGFLCAAMAHAGCGSSATIWRADGPTIEGEIAGSSDGVLQVRGYGGAIHEIDARQVRDIDHPGNVALVLGLVMTALGGLVLSTGDDNATTPAVAFLLLPGITSAVVGTHQYTRSRDAAHDVRVVRAAGTPQRNRDVPRLRPPIPSSPPSTEKPTPGLPPPDAPPPMPQPPAP